MALYVGKRRASAKSEIIEAHHNTFLFSPTPLRILTIHPLTAGFAFRLRKARGPVEGHPVHHDGLPTTSARHCDPTLPLIFIPSL